jgi:hypothetical protein
MMNDTKNKILWVQVGQMEFWSGYEFLHYLFDSAVTCSSNAYSKPIKVLQKKMRPFLSVLLRLI